MENEVRKLLANPPADEEGNVRLTLLSDTLDAGGAKALVSSVAEVPKGRVTVAYASNDRINYILALGDGASGSCRERLQLLNAALGGRGGGKDSLAQGSAPACGGWQEILRKVLV